ncbi:DUF421 domain-containing protein [Alkalihalobacterium chitinilyticum]|uniref:DUF421 domain-containing protein n=1 Tax=Alkalihalobacterium chitinilyticum TaxID=2980103 RepID=A0ABT5V9Q8_9BACI|nr:DUF421 domain-containing protein [Alkalihalobacterium chitinilyticum]MDE5412020.1 DUF421 domain-containing protein [Alkalihalobacterium chitinilyticum]
MNTNFFYLTTELITGFFALLVITKVLGKTQITQLTPFDFISALVLGELVGNAIYDKDIGLNYVIYAVIVWGTLIYSVEWLTQKYKGTRNFLQGKPSIVIREGNIDYQQLKKDHMDINQLQQLLRQKDVFSIREVQYGILESNGSLSILKKDNYEQPNKKDLNMQSQHVFLPITLILDGEILVDNLRESGYNLAWLKQQLFTYGITDEKEVFYAEWLEGDSLYINTYSS